MQLTTQKKGGENVSRAIGRHFLPDGTGVPIRQDMHIQPNGEYEIQDTEKRAEFEKRKAEQLKEIKENKGE